MKKRISNILTRRIKKLEDRKLRYSKIRRYIQDTSLLFIIKLMIVNFVLRLFGYKNFDSRVIRYSDKSPEINIESEIFSVKETGTLKILKEILTKYNRFKIKKYQLEELNKDTSLNLSCKLDMYVLGECRGDEEHKANLETAKNTQIGNLYNILGIQDYVN